jgi:hypothetical protein
MFTVGEGLERAQDRTETAPAVIACRLLDRSGGEIACGEALVTTDDGFLVATVQGLTPVGAVTLAIFARGLRHFILELPGWGRHPVELIASRFRSGSNRVCFFRSLGRIEPARHPLPTLPSA